MPTRSLNVLVVTLGSHGDVHPFVGIALALQKRGHDVTMITSPKFQTLCMRANLPLIPLGTIEEFDRIARDPRLWHRTKGFQRVVNGFSRTLRPQYDAIVQHNQPDRTILVLSTLGLGGRVAQDKLGLPAVSVHLSPACFRSAVVPALTPPLPVSERMPTAYNRLIYRLADLLAIDLYAAPAVNLLRKEEGLRPVSGIFRSYLHSPQRAIALFPQWFAPPQPDWPAQARCTGFPLYDEADISPMSDELLRFLDAGEKPIAFTPGSAMYFGEHFFQVAVAVCARLGRRGLLLTQHRGHLPLNLPPDILHVDYAPFGKLLPRVAALVHHGGIGTTSQALASGTPQLLMPMAHDQFDNARRITRLGVGESLPAEKFELIPAAAALARLLDSPDIRSACDTIRARFIGQHPLDETCDLIEQTAVTSGLTFRD